MKKGLKKLVAGLVTSAALCIPVVGATAPTTTANASSLSGVFDHINNVFDELSKINDHSEFDPWFENYWKNNYYKWPNSSKLEIYSVFYGIWYNMKHPYRPSRPF